MMDSSTSVVLICPLITPREGHCWRCGGPLPKRRRRWCSDTCGRWYGDTVGHLRGSQSDVVTNGRASIAGGALHGAGSRSITSCPGMVVATGSGVGTTTIIWRRFAMIATSK